MKIKSSAKVNLSLDILKKDSNNYHQLRTVYLELPKFYDEIEIKPYEKGIHLELFENYKIDEKVNLNIPKDKNNSAYKAAELIKTAMGIKDGISIKLIKNIPPGSGFGGASSNAASVLKAVNKMWKLNLNADQLMILAAKIGMDVAFFIKGGLAIGEHYGEVVSPITVKADFIKKLQAEIKPILSGISVSTKESYEKLNPNICGKNIRKTEKIMEALKEGNLLKIIKNIHNDFEKSVYKSYPELKIKKTVLNTKHKKVCLIGSGGSFFAI